jgi:hypothetical protein
LPGVCRVAGCCRVPVLPGLLPGLLPGAAGCCRVLPGLLPGAAGCCRVLPGAARLRRCGGTSRCCRVLPGAAGLPVGCRFAGLPVGCRVGLSGLLPGLCSGCQVGDSVKQ